jgi:hypothetical protein
MNQLTAALPAANTNTTPALVSLKDLTPLMHTGTVRTALRSSSAQAAPKQGKIRTALTRWFGGWNYMSVEGFFTSTGTSNLGFILVGPYFVAVPRTPRTNRQFD